ncbi:hypothetical protein [Pararhodobacter aggregans]|nr:hypothetical protein [Pararhodobacter aggregans]PTX00109.1 hypothetical protein C8N33_1116 [Pararhodobacter aggregans]
MTEAEIEALLAAAGLVPGAAPLTKQQLTDRIMAILDRDWPLAMREASPVEYAAWRDAAEPARLRAVEANLFNIRLAAYRQAVARLALFRLAEGRAAVSETLATGDLDAEGQPLFQTVIVQAAIAPLPAQIERPVIDPLSGEQTGSESLANPSIAEDEAARAAAQALIAATPAAVVAFAAA